MPRIKAVSSGTAVATFCALLCSSARASAIMFPGKNLMQANASLDWLISKYLAPHHKGYHDLDGIKTQELYPLLRWAANHYHDPKYEKVLNSLAGPHLNTQRIELLFPPRT